MPPAHSAGSGAALYVVPVAGARVCPAVLPVPAGSCRRPAVQHFFAPGAHDFCVRDIRTASFCCATRAAKKGAAGKTSSVFLFCRVGVSFCALSVVAWADMQAGSGGPNGGSGYPRISCVRIRVRIYRALTSVYPAFATHGIAFRRPYDRTASLCFLPPHLPAGAVFLQPARRLSFLRLRPAPLFCSTPAPFYTPSDLFRRARRIPRPAPERAGRRTRDGQAVIFVVPLLPKRPRGKTGKRQSGKICLSPRRPH